MSENPRDDQELKAFLAGESVLSRRYRALADEEPPSHIDDAVLASARWAVGADTHRVGKTREDSRWQRRPFMRWGVPLAMAAVVVLAVALTLTVERDPELDRIYDRYELDRSDVAMSDARGPAEEVTLGAASKPDREPTLQLAEKDQVVTEQPSAVIADDLPPALPQAKPAPEELKKKETSVAVAPAGTEARSGVVAKSAPAPATVAASVKPQPPVTAARQRATPAPAPAPQSAAVLGNIAAPPPREAEPVVMAEPAISEEETSFADESFASERASVAGRAEEGDVAVESADSLAASPQLADAGTSRSPEQWVADIEAQLKRGNRELARAAVKRFRQSHPDYPLPQRLLELLPESER